MNKLTSFGDGIEISSCEILKSWAYASVDWGPLFGW